jgi:hypothetical protein
MEQLFGFIRARNEDGRRPKLSPEDRRIIEKGQLKNRWEVQYNEKGKIDLDRTVYKFAFSGKKKLNKDAHKYSKMYANSRLQIMESLRKEGLANLNDNQLRNILIEYQGFSNQNGSLP